MLRRSLSNVAMVVTALLITCLLQAPTAMAADMGGPNSARECAMCHINWIDIFYRQGQSTDLVEYPKEKLVAAEMMCYSCHDGSIVDSRLKVWETSRHKTGIKPSANISIPKEYPLDKDGNMQCATCHSAHGVDTKPGMADTIFLREPNINSSMCRRCHVNKRGGVKNGNHPLDVNLKKRPAKIINNGGKLGANDTVICQTCHTPHGSTNEHFLVIPNSKGSLSHSQLCETCHTKSPDISANDSKRRFSHPVDVPLQKEAMLPAKWDNGKKPYISFDGNINCITCHSPHNAMKNNHLLQTKNSKGELCVTCHTSKKSIYDTKHDIAKYYPNEKNADGIKASETGSCKACHFMHKGEAPRMWARKVSDSSIGALCLSCHSKNKVAKNALTGAYTHPVNVKLSDKDLKVPFPLFNDIGKVDPEGKVSCPTCHDVHKWSPLSADKGGKEIEGDGENSFLRMKSTRNSELCQTCHKTKSTIVKTKHDLERTDPNAKILKDRDPDRYGLCRTCHAVHNARSVKLWAIKSGEGKGSIEPLCTSCHSDGEAASKKMTGKISHPTGPGVSPNHKIDTELPLHTAEGDRARTGNVSCATCHNVHRWAPDDASNRGSKKKEGDGSNSFLRMKYAGTNELCRECHEGKFSLEKTKHDLKLTAPSSRNDKRETVKKSGVCGACHRPHNGSMGKLWARKGGKGADLIEKACTSCHSGGNVAEGKWTGGRSHPLGKKPNMVASMKEYLPLYDLDGVRSVDGGVTCSTCHDVHRWEPGSDIGPGKKKIEGDRFNSFLRVPNDDDAKLCSACHQENALVIGTDHDLTVTSPSSKNVLGQKASKAGVCGSCHVVHNAWGIKLWGQDVGEGNNRVEALCKGCHMKKKVAAKKKISYPSHPMDMQVSDAKDTLKREMETFYKEGVDRYSVTTDLPLYSEDGNKSSQGDVTCATCHNVHRWNPDKKAKGEGKNIEGNGGNSFLRKSNLGKSGLCITCHKEKKYVFQTDHDMSVSKPGIKNVNNNTVSESGVCSACHVPHGASASYKLWATNIGNQSDFLPEKLCLGCHSSGGGGAAKLVERFRHPRDVVISELTNGSEKSYAPLYDEKGNEVQTGKIACPTCHNPHLWQTGNLEKGSGKNEEGNNRNSFLRLKSAASICKDCHGFDGLIRYKFFHSNRVRTGGL